MAQSISELFMQRILDARSNDDFHERLDDNRTKIIDSAKNSKPITAVQDSYGNELLSIGNNNKVEEYSKYTMSNNTLNWPLWMALYNDSWVFKKAIDKPAQDMIRCGIKLQGKSDFNRVYRVLKSHRSDFIQLLKWGALFGGSVAVMMFDGLEDADYARKIDINKIKGKTIRMYIVDRWYGVSPTFNNTVTKMNDFDYSKPRYYDITLADGKTIKFHHDYVLRYEHRDAPKFVKNGMLQGWGYAEGAHILNVLSEDEKLQASIQSLVDKSLIEIIKMPGMKGIFMGADTQNEEQLRKRLEMVNWGRGFNSLTFLDKDDEYEMNNFQGLTGLSDILQQNMWKVAAATDMSGILFGDLKNGFSQDDAALERYDEAINNKCEDFLRPIYNKFLSLIYKIEGIDERVEFEFNSLLINKQDKETMEGFKDFAELCRTLQECGVLDAPQIAKALKNFTTKHIIDFELDDETMKKIEENEANELESIDLDNPDRGDI